MIEKLPYKRIIIFGPPGVGKGTLAARIAFKNNFQHISTGVIFRNEIKAQSKLGKELEALVASGAYVPDNITNEIVKKVLLEKEKNHQGYLLDGYPRTDNQLEFLLKIIHVEDLVVLTLEAPSAIILKRLSGRRVCLNCKRQYHMDFQKPLEGEKCDFDQRTLVQRPDDFPEVIKKRIQIYESSTAVLQERFAQAKILYHLDASGNPEVVYQRFKKLMSDLALKKKARN